jgi:hypothetical protein
MKISKPMLIGVQTKGQNSPSELLYLSENSGGVLFLSVCGCAVHTQKNAFRCLRIDSYFTRIWTGIGGVNWRGKSRNDFNRYDSCLKKMILQNLDPFAGNCFPDDPDGLAGLVGAI